MLPGALRFCARHWQPGGGGGVDDDDGRGASPHVVVVGLRRRRRRRRTAHRPRGRRLAAAAGRRRGGGGRLVPLQEGAGIHRLLDELLGQLAVEARVRLLDVGVRRIPLGPGDAAMLLPPL